MVVRACRRPSTIDEGICSGPLTRDGECAFRDRPKEKVAFPRYASIPSPRGPATLRKNDSVDVRGVAKLACRLQCFNPFRARRQASRLGQGLVGAGFDIVRTRRLLGVHVSPMSASEARRKTSRLLPTSSDRRKPALRGCARIWCISASTARIPCGPRSRLERVRGPGIADTADVPPRATSSSEVVFRSCLLPCRSGGSTTLSVTDKSRGRSVMPPVNAS